MSEARAPFLVVSLVWGARSVSLLPPVKYARFASKRPSGGYQHKGS